MNHSLKQFNFLTGLWKKNGGELIKFSAAEQQKLKKTLATVGDTVLGKDPALKATYERLKKAVAATR